MALHCERHREYLGICDACIQAKRSHWKKPRLAEYLGAEPVPQEATQAAKAPIVEHTPTPLGQAGLGHRRNDAPTSVAAAKSFSEERLTELQALVLGFYRGRGEATDEELEDALMGSVPAASTLRKRRGDLVTKGWLRDSGRTRPNRNKRQMVVWELAGTKQFLAKALETKEGTAEERQAFSNYLQAVHDAHVGTGETQ